MNLIYILFIIIIIIIYVNIYFYRILFTLSKTNCYKVETIRLLESPENYKVYFNPSILKFKDREIICYRHDYRDVYRVCNRNLKSSLYLTHNNKNLEILSVDTSLEDPRMFQVCDKLYIYFTNYYHDKGKSRVSICNLKLSREGTITITPSDIQTDFKLQRIEKNWMSLVHNDDVFFVYSLNPFILLKYDVYTGYAKKVFEKRYSDLRTDLRGTSTFVKFGGKYIGISHRKNSSFFYTHQLVILEGEYPFNIQKVSRDFILYRDEIIFITNKIPFPFIQFISGLEIDDGKLILTYGCWNKTSKKSIIDLSLFEL